MGAPPWSGLTAIEDVMASILTGCAVVVCALGDSRAAKHRIVTLQLSRLLFNCAQSAADVRSYTCRRVFQTEPASESRVPGVTS
jgi:hypothetical protein